MFRDKPVSHPHFRRFKDGAQGNLGINCPAPPQYAIFINFAGKGRLVPFCRIGGNYIVMRHEHRSIVRRTALPTIHHTGFTYQRAFTLSGNCWIEVSQQGTEFIKSGGINLPRIAGRNGRNPDHAG